jgi:hypothetical protein
VAAEMGLPGRQVAGKFWPAKKPSPDWPIKYRGWYFDDDNDLCIFCNRMRYHGTDIEVRLGDRVVYKHLLWGQSNGVVAYIPGVSQLHSSIGLHQWVLKLNSGKCVFMLFTPQLEFAHHRVKFIGRGAEDVAIGPKDPIF